MRNGSICGTVKKTDTSEAELAHMMIGRELETLEKPGTEDMSNRRVRLAVKDLSIKPKDHTPLLEDINFEIHEGEVLGFAGVSDNGQQELCEAIYGGIPITSGKIELDGEDVTNESVKDRIKLGMGYAGS